MLRTSLKLDPSSEPSARTDMVRRKIEIQNGRSGCETCQLTWFYMLSLVMSDNSALEDDPHIEA